MSKNSTVTPVFVAPDWNFDPLDEEVISRIEAFLSIPEEERAWPASLGRDLLPRYMKTKLSVVKVPKGKPSSTALSLFRSSARLASFTAKDLKAGVARIAEQSKSQEASGSDKTLDVLVSNVQSPQEPPRLVSPEVVQASKRRRETVVPEEEGREKEPIQAQPIRSVSARMDDMDAARAQIDGFSASMSSSQLLSDNNFDSSTKVVYILSSLVTRAAALASQAKEGLEAGLVTACQLRDAQARISSLEEKLDKVNRELHISRGNEVVLQSQLGSATEASRAALGNSGSRMTSPVSICDCAIFFPDRLDSNSFSLLISASAWAAFS
ncbi:uncharacterized protein LOC141655345 [Silene latifolia]|uniref:uncharacterized protein LOC141655345 n=1 Tax=Silene latifolia TaxID=37657 RepID=UPI003D77DD5A